MIDQYSSTTHKTSRTFALAAALVNVASGVVEHTQHRHEAIRGAVGTANIGALGADVVRRDANATGVLRDLGAVLCEYDTTHNGGERIVEEPAQRSKDRVPSEV